MRLSRRQFLLGGMGACAALAPVGWYGTVQEPDDIEIVRHTLPLRNLPSSLEGVTAAQVSDIHLGEISEAQRRMLDQLVALDPDLVLVTGDLVDDDAAVGELADLLGGYQPRLGTWAVPGNRDHKAEAVDSLRQALESRNVHLLVNQSAQVEDRFWIVGVDDPSDRRDDVKGALGDVPKEAIRILLAHAPNVVERLGGTPFDLILAGHTHGGQVNLPLLRYQWLQDDSARRYPAGLYSVGDSRLYVNRGIGTYYLPIRIGARPEITLFTLHGE
jgi:predicted MPP superfamily phosphohydrolase